VPDRALKAVIAALEGLSGSSLDGPSLDRILRA
jgi:hypothetical protein